MGRSTVPRKYLRVAKSTSLYTQTAGRKVFLEILLLGISQSPPTQDLAKDTIHCLPGRLMPACCPSAMSSSTPHPPKYPGLDSKLYGHAPLTAVRRSHLRGTRQKVETSVPHLVPQLLHIVDLLQGNHRGCKTVAQLGQQHSVPEVLLQLHGRRKLLLQAGLHPAEGTRAREHLSPALTARTPQL